MFLRPTLKTTVRDDGRRSGVLLVYFEQYQFNNCVFIINIKKGSGGCSVF